MASTIAQLPNELDRASKHAGWTAEDFLLFVTFINQYFNTNLFHKLFLDQALLDMPVRLAQQKGNVSSRALWNLLG